MKNSIKKNYIYNLIYEILALLIPLVTTPYVSRVLGATAIGDYSYTVGIVSYFGIIAATGTKNFGQREMAICQDDKHERSIIFWEIFGFRTFCTILVSVLYFLFISSFMPQYTFLFQIQILTVISWLVDISWFFQGMENFKITAVRNSFVKIAGTILIFIFVKKTEDLWIYTLIFSATNLLGNITMWAYIKTEVIIPKVSEIKIFRNVKEIFSLFIPVIAIQVYTILDKTMLGTFCNTTEVGYYSQAEKIIKLALTVLSSFIAVLVPRLSVLFNQGNKEKINDYYKSSLDYIMLLALPMMFGCVAVSDCFVPIFFGKGYDVVIPIMYIMSLLFVILSLGQLYGNYLVAMKTQKFYSIAVTSAAIVNVFFNLVFIMFFDLGAIGVSIATIIAELTSTVIQFYALKDILNPRYLIASFRKYALPSIVMFISIILCKQIFEQAFIKLAISVVIGVLIYILILFVKKDSVIMTLISEVNRKIKKK